MHHDGVGEEFAILRHDRITAIDCQHRLGRAFGQHVGQIHHRIAREQGREIDPLLIVEQPKIARFEIAQIFNDAEADGRVHCALLQIDAAPDQSPCPGRHTAYL